MIGGTTNMHWVSLNGTRQKTSSLFEEPTAHMVLIHGHWVKGPKVRKIMSSSD